jgi:glutaconyl-CoA/methylmalonyl-CoA decarboxylase subunit gamma
VLRQFKVTVNGREYDVSVMELTGGPSTSSPMSASLPVAPAASYSAVSASPAAAPKTEPAPPSAGDVLAGMGGLVVEVDVKVGQRVTIGDRLLVLEAMKMKTPIAATHSGLVTRVLVAAGDAVEGGQPVVSIA